MTWEYYRQFKCQHPESKFYWSKITPIRILSMFPFVLQQQTELLWQRPGLQSHKYLSTGFYRKLSNTWQYYYCKGIFNSPIVSLTHPDWRSDFREDWDKMCIEGLLTKSQAGAPLLCNLPFVRHITTEHYYNLRRARLLSACGWLKLTIQSVTLIILQE